MYQPTLLRHHRAIASTDRRKLREWVMAMLTDCCQKRWMKLSQISHVIAVAQWRSLKRTAEETGTSPNALSRSIGEIERELGTALFKRSSKAMTLTPVGKIFVRRAAAAQRELDDARQEIRQGAGGLADPDDASEVSSRDGRTATS